MLFRRRNFKQNIIENFKDQSSNYNRVSQTELNSDLSQIKLQDCKRDDLIKTPVLSSVCKIKSFWYRNKPHSRPNEIENKDSKKDIHIFSSRG